MTEQSAGAARQVIVSLRASLEPLHHRGARINARASSKAVEVLGASEREVSSPSAPALDQARRHLLAAAATQAGIVSAPPRDLRYAPWLLWDGAEPLAPMRGLIELIVNRAASSASTRRNLIEAWLRGFDRNAPRIEEDGPAIRVLLAKTADLRLDRWRSADRAFSLFDADRGPKELAAAILRGPGTVDEVVHQAGLDEPLRGVGGYARAVLAEALPLIPDALRSETPKWSRAAEFLAPRGTMRCGDAASMGAVGRACLGAWRDGGRQPSEAAQVDVQAFLLRHLHDPRVQPARWREVG